MFRARHEPLLAALVCMMAVAAALVSQHVYDMQPCPWCVLQRLLFVILAALGLIEAVVGSLALSGLRFLAAIAGVASATWQHTVASSSASCNLTLADRILAATGLDGALPDIFQPRASCLEAKAWLLGVPYEFYSGALFVALAGLAATTAWRRVKT